MNGTKLSVHQAERLHKFAHDLRNRLAGLHQALQHVADSGNGEKKEILEYGEQQFFKALREVETLLNDLGVERGEQIFDAKPILLAELVRTEAEHLKFRFDGKNQQLKLELDPDLKVNGDERLVSNSIAALLSNASKFSPHGTAVEVRSRKQNDLAELCVIDQGVGLTEDDLKKIFVRYEWLSSRSTNGEAQGRGTLARTAQWAKGMGGAIAAESEGPGKGCAFTLRLPLA